MADLKPDVFLREWSGRIVDDVAEALSNVSGLDKPYIRDIAW